MNSLVNCLAMIGTEDSLMRTGNRFLSAQIKTKINNSMEEIKF